MPDPGFAVILVGIIGEVLPKRTVIKLLFDGAIDDNHKTKYFFKEITDRYKGSIKGFNRAMAFNIGFAIIALYAYLALPPASSVTIPFVALPVSRLVWISLVPLISYVLQTFIMTSFVWFMILRLGTKLLNQEIGVNEEFGDATNIVLDGAIGHIWIILRIRQFFKSKLNLIWYMPAVTLFLVVMASPVLICIYFIVQLFAAKSIVLGIIYSLLFIPYSALFLLLIATASILGMGEFNKSIGHASLSQK
jgi:hypothetical protein